MRDRALAVGDVIAIRTRHEDNVGVRHPQIIGKDDNVITAVPRPDAVDGAIARLRLLMRSPAGGKKPGFYQIEKVLLKVKKVTASPPAPPH